MDPITLALLASGAAAIPQLFKMGSGLFKNAKARKLDKQYNLGNRPKASMSEGFNQYMSLQEKLAGSDLPGRDLAEGDIRQSTAQGLTGVRQLASNESSAMAGLLGMMDQERKGLRDLGQRALQWRAQQQQNLGGAYLRKDQEQQRLFTENQMNPWATGMNMADSYRNAGNQDFMSGLDGLSNAAIQGANIYQTQQAYDRMMPNWGNTNNGYPPMMPSGNYIPSASQNLQAPNPFAQQPQIPVNGYGYNYNYNNI